MSNRIITISREFGSGGRTIGKEAAEKLGIPCYDHELIEKIAEESGFAKEYVAERGEHTSRGFQVHLLTVIFMGILIRMICGLHRER